MMRKIKSVHATKPQPALGAWGIRSPKVFAPSPKSVEAVEAKRSVTDAMTDSPRSSPDTSPGNSPSKRKSWSSERRRPSDVMNTSLSGEITDETRSVSTTEKEQDSQEEREARSSDEGQSEKKKRSKKRLVKANETEVQDDDLWGEWQVACKKNKWTKPVQNSAPETPVSAETASSHLEDSAQNEVEDAAQKEVEESVQDPVSVEDDAQSTAAYSESAVDALESAAESPRAKRRHSWSPVTFVAETMAWADEVDAEELREAKLAQQKPKLNPAAQPFSPPSSFSSPPCCMEPYQPQHQCYPLPPPPPNAYTAAPETYSSPYASSPYEALYEESGRPVPHPLSIVHDPYTLIGYQYASALACYPAAQSTWIVSIPHHIVPGQETPMHEMQPMQQMPDMHYGPEHGFVSHSGAHHEEFMPSHMQGPPPFMGPEKPMCHPPVEPSEPQKEPYVSGMLDHMAIEEAFLNGVESPTTSPATSPKTTPAEPEAAASPSAVESVKESGESEGAQDMSEEEASVHENSEQVEVA